MNGAEKPDLVEGTKFDDGKPMMDLIPPDVMLVLGQVYTMGAHKYEARNWEKGMRWGRPIAAILRHLMAFMGGQDNDPESGLPHTAHIAWTAMALCAFQLRKVGIDDRFKLESLRDDK